MITEADVRGDLARMIRDLEDALSAASDNYTARRLRDLAQRLQDAVAEIDNPGSEYDAVRRVTQKGARIQTYLIGHASSYIVEVGRNGCDGYGHGRTLVEAFRTADSKIGGAR